MKPNETVSVRRAAFITGASRYSVVAINLITTMVLARILSPSDFGIVSIVTVFTAFFTLLSDFGIGTGIIQDKTLTAEEISGIYSFNVLISVAMAIAFLPFSWALAYVYDNSIYASFGPILSLSLFFSSMSTIPKSLCLRDKRFAIVGIANLSTAVLGGIAAVIFASLGLGPYALVYQSLMMTISACLIQEVAARREYALAISLKPTLSGLKKIFDYSMRQFGFNVINYFARNLDNALIGKVMGAKSLGYYDKAYKLTTFPVSYLTAVIASALHPILSDYQDDPSYIYERYVPIVKFISLAGAIISPLFIFCARELILLAFGAAWEESVVPFSILAFSIWFQMTSSSCGAIYMSSGRTDMQLRSCLIFVPVQVACIITGVLSRSLTTCAIFVSVSFIFKFLIEYWFLIHNSLSHSYLNFLKNFIPDLIIEATIAISLCTLQLLLPPALLPTPVALILKAALAFAVWIAMLRSLSQESYLYALLPGKLRRRVTKLFGMSDGQQPKI